MKKYSLFILTFLLLLAGCSHSGSADSDPETFLRDLYGDRIVTQDGKFFYHWNAGERYLDLEHDTEYLQPLLASDYDRYDVLITDGSLSVVPESLTQESAVSFEQPITPFILNCAFANSYDSAWFEAAYVDVKLGGDWYAIFMPPAIFLDFPLEAGAEVHVPFIRLDDPNAAIPNGNYRVTLVVTRLDDTCTRCAVSAEFTIRNGELAG